MLSSADQERSSYLFHEVPTQTQRSFAAISTANNENAVLTKKKCNKLCSKWTVKQPVVVARVRVKFFTDSTNPSWTLPVDGSRLICTTKL